MKHTQQLSQILQAGAREFAFHEHARSDGTVLHTPKPAATAGVISLRGMQLSPQAGDVRALRSDQPVPAGKLLPLDAALMKHSRIAAAGATIIVHAPAPVAHSDVSAGLVLMERPSRFTLIEAAPLALVPDGSTVATTDPALSRATLTFAGPSYAVQHVVTRRDLSTYGFDSIAEQLMESIAFGLARACDHALLTAIVATTPAAFSIGSVAAAGFDWSELRSFVGTDGVGAALAPDGVLRAAGIPATLTPTIVTSITGSFSRAAVGVMDDLRVLVERRGLNGGLVVTAWADVQALLPNAAAFWSIA